MSECGKHTKSIVIMQSKASQPVTSQQTATGFECEPIISNLFIGFQLTLNNFKLLVLEYIAIGSELVGKLDKTSPPLLSCHFERDKFMIACEEKSLVLD